MASARIAELIVEMPPKEQKLVSREQDHHHIGGRKKLFGYEDTCLIMSMRHSGEQQRWIIGHDPQWASRSAQAILGAHERHALKNS